MFRFLTLAPGDPRFEPFTRGEELPFLCCMRCELSWYNFAYQVVTGGGIRLLTVHTGESFADEWAEAGGGDLIPRVDVRVVGTPPAFEQMNAKINDGLDLTPAEEAAWLAIISQTGRGGMDLDNQVGGIPFSMRGNWLPPCPVCSRPCVSAATLADSPTDGWVVSPMVPHVQVSFFLCPDCRAVVAVNNC